MQSIDRSFDDLFRGIAGLPLQFASQQRSWQGSVLTFSMLAKMGLMRAPIRGTLATELILDIDLGLLERILATTKAKEVLASRVRGLLR
ncbi:MAG TPA: hypothetical protein VLJ11_06275 [Bryobacteraceae bacterium]|nr:hypothetical protein [Bryobacteraceae bacterium]